MNARQQNLALALHMGWQLKWQDSETLRVLNPHGNLADLAYCNGRTQEETVNDLHYCFPNYHGDLNQIREVILTLKNSPVDFNGTRYRTQKNLFVCILNDILSRQPAGTFQWPSFGPTCERVFDIASASSDKLTEAVLITLSLWRE